MENKYYSLCVLETGSGDSILAYADCYEATAGCLAEVVIAGDRILCTVADRYNSVSDDCIRMLEDAGLISAIEKLYGVQWEKREADA